MSDFDDGVMNLLAILAIWIFIFAIGFREHKDDSTTMKLAKQILRHTFTMTLVVCVLMAGWVLWFTDAWK